MTCKVKIWNGPNSKWLNFTHPTTTINWNELKVLNYFLEELPHKKVSLLDEDENCSISNSKPLDNKWIETAKI